MPEIAVQTVDNALATLLQTEKDFPGFALDICSGYISTSGILPLRNLLKSSTKVRPVRAILGLNPTNRVDAFEMLQDLQVKVYVYVTSSYGIFHPKIYLGTLNTQAWAMIGSSNLTKSGLSLNVEHNLFITGQRHTEPFISIATRIETFCNQAYIFDEDIKKKLRQIERELGRNPQEEKYKERLYKLDIRPRAKLEPTIPAEAQQIALDTLFEFANEQKLEYAYQMLLLLVMLKHSDEGGRFSVAETARSFAEFYRLRREAGYLYERKRGSKTAVVDNPNTTLDAMGRMVKTRPFPRFEREGLLDLSEDGHYFMVNPALLAALTPNVREQLQEIAIRRMAEHFEVYLERIRVWVEKAIG